MAELLIVEDDASIREILHMHLNALQIPHEYRKYPDADHNFSLIL